MYCPECGHKIDEQDVLFCPECGTRLNDNEAIPQTSVGESSIQAKSDDDPNTNLASYIVAAGINLLFKEGMKLFDKKQKKQSIEQHEKVDSIEEKMYGIILTNIRLLSTKLNTKEETIRSLLNMFITQKRYYGVYYQLADVSNYTYYKSGIIGKKRTVHLDAESEIWQYMDILMDIHKKEVNSSLPQSEYLFIIGDDDIIPTGKIRHYMANDPNFHDKDIESDMLYEYPYGREMLRDLESQKLFSYEQLFYAGRLPVSSDTSLKDLSNYLDRAISCSNGIPMQGAYIQTDPNWKRMTATAANTLIKGNWLRDLDGYLIDGCYFKGLILSPLVVSQNVHQVFDKNATIYFFNLHGSNAEKIRGYWGNHCPINPQKPCVSVILPEHLQTCEYPNLIFSGACYGARYKNMGKYSSMVLSSLYKNTLLFIGSSRMAFGGNEPLDTQEQCVPISHGDVLAKSFWDSIMKGNVVGKALFDGRSAVFLAKPGHPLSATTMVEFNVYGDPTLHLNVSRSSQNYDKHKTETVNRIANIDNYECETEKVELGTNSSSYSILDQVRQKVDNNILLIHDVVSQHLYKSFGIEPRPADSIFKLKYANGTGELIFNYDINTNSSLPVRYIVETTENGKILNIITSK